MPLPSQPEPRHRRTARRRDRAHVGHRGVRLLAVVLVGAGVLSAAVVMAVGLGPQRVEPVVDTAARVTAAAADPGHLRQPGSATGRAVGLPARGPVVRAADVLRAWDRRRARAWAEGDVAGLRELYVDRAGVADVRLLRSWADRGYQVEGLATQLLAVDVLEQRPGRWLLRVTDRIASAVAVRGRERVPLPRDREDTHVVRLVRGHDGTWRVAEVRRMPR